MSIRDRINNIIRAELNRQLDRLQHDENMSQGEDERQKVEVHQFLKSDDTKRRNKQRNIFDRRSACAHFSFTQMPTQEELQTRYWQSVAVLYAELGHSAARDRIVRDGLERDALAYECLEIECAVQQSTGEEK
jgi:hypothetical protein